MVSYIYIFGRMKNKVVMSDEAMSEELNKTEEIKKWLSKRSEGKLANECIDMFVGYMYGVGRKPNVTQIEYYDFVETITKPGANKVYYSIVEKLISAIANS